MFRNRLRFLHIIKKSLHIPVWKGKRTLDLTDAWLSVSSFDLSEDEPEDESEDGSEDESINDLSNQDESIKGSSQDESIKESSEFDLDPALLNGTAAFAEDDSPSYNKLT